MSKRKLIARATTFLFLICFSSASFASRPGTFEVCAALLLTVQSRLLAPRPTRSIPTIDGILNEPTQDEYQRYLTRNSYLGFKAFRRQQLASIDNDQWAASGKKLFALSSDGEKKRINAGLKIRGMEKSYEERGAEFDTDFIGVTFRGEADILQFLGQYENGLNLIMDGTDRYAREYKAKNILNYTISTGLVLAIFINASHYLNLMRFLDSEKSKLRYFMDTLRSRSSNSWAYSHRAIGIPISSLSTPKSWYQIDSNTFKLAAMKLLRSQGTPSAYLEIDQALYFEKDENGKQEPVLNIFMRINKPWTELPPPNRRNEETTAEEELNLMPAMIPIRNRDK